MILKCAKRILVHQKYKSRTNLGTQSIRRKETKKTWTCKWSLAPLKSEREEVRREKEG